MLEFTVTVETVKKGYRRTFNDLSRASFLDIGKWAHRNLADERFKVSHAKKAGYTPRSENYVRTKIRKTAKQGGGALDARVAAAEGLYRPLDFSGKSKRASVFAVYRATSQRVEVKYRGLRVFNYKSKGQNVNMLREWLTFLPTEAGKLTRRYDNLMKQQIKNLDLEGIFQSVRKQIS